ncbi:hypothetical protein WA026_019191 [Henosepilachna vigintioctopunctata]|uniref:Uncharacterized protein n=1 Tax=Henosepilachna vigintioctopunctata TaxID=420089 RepID=A0AAW1UTZ9_9CUCU
MQVADVVVTRVKSWIVNFISNDDNIELNSSRFADLTIKFRLKSPMTIIFKVGLIMSANRFSKFVKKDLKSVHRLDLYTASTTVLLVELVTHQYLLHGTTDISTSLAQIVRKLNKYLIDVPYRNKAGAEVSFRYLIPGMKIISIREKLKCRFNAEIIKSREAIKNKTLKM